MPDYDPRLVDLYDVDNPDGPDHDHYRALADARGARTILDLGCGTGLLTVTFARAGRTVVGVDPSRTMLDHARRRPGGDVVTWILGDSASIPEEPFDMAVLTGNVAQHILDPDWARTLRDIRRRMQVGGILAFESRNPDARAWETWASDAPTTRDTPHGTLVEWAEVALVDVGSRGTALVELTSHNRFVDAGETGDAGQTVIEVLRLAFRSRATIERELDAAGFEVVAVDGDWHGTPFDGAARLMVFEAHAR